MNLSERIGIQTVNKNAKISRSKIAFTRLKDICRFKSPKDTEIARLKKTIQTFDRSITAERTARRNLDRAGSGELNEVIIKEAMRIADYDGEGNDSIRLFRVTETEMGKKLIYGVLGLRKNGELFSIADYAHDVSRISGRITSLVILNKCAYYLNCISGLRQGLFKISELDSKLAFGEDVRPGEIMGRIIQNANESRVYEKVEIPIFIGDEVIAILVIENSESKRPIDEEIVLKLFDYARDVGNKIFNLDRATKDPLTGIYNRLGFQERFIEELEEALLRNKKPLSLIMFDLDNLKTINDSLGQGHSAGDATLKGIAKLLREKVHSAVTGRIGGDEFCVLLPEVGKEDAVKVAERIRSMIGDAVFKSQKPMTSDDISKSQKEEKDIESRTTVSLGVVDINLVLSQLASSKDLRNKGFISSYNEFLSLKDELLLIDKGKTKINERRNRGAVEKEIATAWKIVYDNLNLVMEAANDFADATMYLSKRSGKNKVSVYDPKVDYQKMEEKNGDNGNGKV